VVAIRDAIAEADVSLNVVTVSLLYPSSFSLLSCNSFNGSFLTTHYTCIQAATAAADLATVENLAEVDTDAEKEDAFANKLELRARRP
jgi:hypothetical protein